MYYSTMAYQFPPEVDDLIRKQMATGLYASEGQLLLDALRALETEKEEWLATKEGLDSLDQGEQGVSLQEAFDSVRAKHNISPDA